MSPTKAKGALIARPCKSQWKIRSWCFLWSESTSTRLPPSGSEVFLEHFHAREGFRQQADVPFEFSWSTIASDSTDLIASAARSSYRARVRAFVLGNHAPGPTRTAGPLHQSRAAPSKLRRNLGVQCH